MPPRVHSLRCSPCICRSVIRIARGSPSALLTVVGVERVVSFYAQTDAEASPCRACRDDFSLFGAGALGGALAALGYLVAGLCRSIIAITNQVLSGGDFASADVPVPLGTSGARDVRVPATPKRLAAWGSDPSR
jgi:hypothetical protein